MWQQLNTSMNIPQVLRKYEKYPGLTLNWRMFGSNGHVSRPKGGVLPNYGECYDNYHIKSIVNTKHTQRSHHSNGHQFIYLNNKTAVDTNFHPVLGAYNPKPGGIPDASLYSVMYLNHYAVKSREDYEDKLVRGVDQRHKKTMKFFNDTNAQKMKQCGYLKMPPAVPIVWQCDVMLFGVDNSRCVMCCVDILCCY